MNSSINALLTKLTWQLNDLSSHLKSVERESQSVIQQIDELEDKISQSCFSPIIINPELELNKLNFITQQQEKKDDLIILLKNHQTLETKLKDKLQRVKTELKMLEQYKAREQKAHMNQQQKTQENTMDEWFIQKRESV